VAKRVTESEADVSCGIERRGAAFGCKKEVIIYGVGGSEAVSGVFETFFQPGWEGPDLFPQLLRLQDQQEHIWIAGFGRL